MKEYNFFTKLHSLFKEWLYDFHENETGNTRVLLGTDERNTNGENQAFAFQNRKVYREVEIKIFPKYNFCKLFLKTFYKKGFRYYKNESKNKMIKLFSLNAVNSKETLYQGKYSMKFHFPYEKFNIIDKDNILDYEYVIKKRLAS